MYCCVACGICCTSNTVAGTIWNELSLHDCTSNIMVTIWGSIIVVHSLSLKCLVSGCLFIWMVSSTFLFHRCSSVVLTLAAEQSTLCWAVHACAAIPFFSSCLFTAYLCSFTLSVPFHRCTLSCSPWHLAWHFVHCSFLHFSLSRILHSHWASS